MADDANPRIFVGANGPPEPIKVLTPYEATKIHADDLLIEGRNWADGAKCESQAHADEISRLIDDLNKGADAMDGARVKEKAPLDEQIAEIQDRYNLYIAPLKNKKPGKIFLAIDSLKATLKPFLDAEAKRIADAAAEAKRIADEAAAKAAEALRAAPRENLGAREAAEELMEVARLAEKDANRAAKTKAHARGGSRAIGLTTHYIAEITDRKATLLHYVVRQPDALAECLRILAQVDVDAGQRQIPGVTVRTETRL